MKRKKPISLLMLIFALSLFCSYHIYYYCINELNNKKVDKYIEEIVVNNNPQVIVEKTLETKEDYLGILEIPKLNLKQGFYNIDSKNNDVNKSVMLLKNSVMPDNVNSTIILAAHSGNSYVGYFKNLDKLNIEDKINIYYQKNKYQYTVTNIYELDKNGHILVDKNIHENILVLTTCSKNEEKQLVVYAKLLKISDIK